MNIPNKLTIIRIILAPIFLFFLLCDFIYLHYFFALLVFAVASVTDAVDGHIARKYNLITDFGKFLDPLADKVLVFSALIAFIDMKLASSVAIIIIMGREFLVTSLRLVASSNGKVIAASKLGKLKTAMTMAAVIIILCLLTITEIIPAFKVDTALISNILIWIATAITILSGAEYLFKNREHFYSDK